MARRKFQEINAGSMADIAFLLLIFFLVTTTMDIDKGLNRILPPKLITEEKPPVIKERNVFVVLLNDKNQLLVEGEIVELSNLREETKEFIANPKRLKTLPEFTEKEIQKTYYRMIEVLRTKHILLFKMSWRLLTMSCEMIWQLRSLESHTNSLLRIKSCRVTLLKLMQFERRFLNGFQKQSPVKDIVLN